MTPAQRRLLEGFALALERDPEARMRFEGREMAAAVRAALAAADEISDNRGPISDKDAGGAK
jgi:hypothetical protein